MLVCIEWPALSPSRPFRGSRPSANHSMQAIRPLRVLLLLRDPQLREAILRQLESCGLQPATCQEAGELLAQASAQPPPLCILDATHDAANSCIIAAHLQRQTLSRIVMLT